MPHVIRNQRNSDIIHSYQKFCESEQFKALSVSSLYKILELCPASRRKSKKCLDNYQAEGEEAFNTLEEACYKLDGGHLIQPLRSTRQHLQGTYLTHLSRDDSVVHHCITYALSDRENDGKFSVKCQKAHDQECSECSDMTNTLAKMNILVLEAKNDKPTLELRSKLFDAEKALDKINEWKKHIVRTANQQTSKDGCLKNLQQHQVFIIQDFAMKWLATKFLEGQADWFSKRGIESMYNIVYKGCLFILWKHHHFPPFLSNADIQVILNNMHIFFTCLMIPTGCHYSAKSKNWCFY